jgi:glycosyltransferase involved in cell wall biosynthesis
MAKLLFFTKMNFGNVANSGIKNKVFSQAKAFENLGLETDVLYIDNNIIKIQGKSLNIKQKFESKFKFVIYLYFGYLREIDIQNYDFVYIRHFLTNPLFLFMLQKIKRNKPSIKIFMELPTYPYSFQNNSFNLNIKIQQKIDELCTSFFKKTISKIVTISKDKVIFEIPTVITDNGIEVDKYGIIDSIPFEKNHIHLLGLANVQMWHGFDRLLTGLSNYQKTNNEIHVIFHIVGNGDALDALKKQTENLNLNKSVQFHGFLSGQELEIMFKKCQIGIGVLGLHRVNLAHASALKAREFASRGLPFIAAHDDFGFPEDFPFILKLPADETPINIEKLLEFVKNLEKIPDYRKKMNQYAKENFTWESKLEIVRDNFISQK